MFNKNIVFIKKLNYFYLNFLMKNKFINLKKFYDDNGYCIVKNLISIKKIDLFLDAFKKEIISNKKEIILPSMNLQKITSFKKKK
jgi:ectoine hydroxylase-related dioxygenase (phytanoyl-CoA dioxygenase family)